MYASSDIDNNTGIVIVDHGSKRNQANKLLEQFASSYQEYNDYSIVEPAHMELAEPSIATAFDKCVQRGANFVVICPFFLLPGKHWEKDIPSLSQKAAAKYSNIKYLVTAPIGLHPMIKQVVEGTVNHCLAHIAGKVDECESCKGTGRCQLKKAG